MERGLDGIFFRVQRGGEWKPVCFTDLTEKEIGDLELEKKYDKAAWMEIAMHLRQVVRNLGEAFDIVRADDE